MGRYDGKPLVRLLELYVLWALERLAPDEEAKLVGMAPKLSAMWGGDGSWQSAIATTMKFLVAMPELIRERWDHNTAVAASNAAVLEPQQFAEMFVDASLHSDFACR